MTTNDINNDIILRDTARKIVGIGMELERMLTVQHILIVSLQKVESVELQVMLDETKTSMRNRIEYLLSAITNNLIQLSDTTL